MYLNSFNKSATRPLYPGANHLITRILLEKPKLNRWTFLVPSQGNMAVTVMTEEEVFKGPHNPDQPAEIQRECALLQSLHDIQTGIRIPKVTMVARDGSFYGMERIHATVLTAKRLEALPEDEQMRIAGAIGRFNAQMARQPAGDTVMRTAVTADKLQQAFEDDDFWDEMGGDLSLLSRLETRLRNYPLPPPMLLHGDMHGGNVLYDDATGEIALIDLGAGDLVTPHHCFGVLRSYYSKTFAVEAARAFSAESGVAISDDDLDDYLVLRDLLNLRYCESISWPELQQDMRAMLDRLEAAQPAVAQSITPRPLAAR